MAGRMNAFWAATGRESFMAAQSAREANQETASSKVANVAVPTQREEAAAALAKAAPSSLENFNVRAIATTNQ